MKYQLSRKLFLGRFPEGNDFDFRRMLLSSSYGQRDFERHLFDWQITPFAGLLDYLEHDFQGVFERQDLFAEHGQVIHRRLHMRYPHDFHPENRILDEACIDRQYPSVRDKFEHLARKFRRLMERPGPFLYVIRTTPSRDDAARLRRLLQRTSPQHRFELLFLGWEDGMPAPDLAGVAHFAWVQLASDKSPGREWEGNDGSWDDALSSWSLTIHGDGRVSEEHQAEAGTEQPLRGMIAPTSGSTG